jgi:hypothetical protein
MAKITSRAQINVGTELTIDEPNRTFTLNVAGNLIAKDGVTLQALYSKFVDLWNTSTYQDSPFPMYTIDARSGQFQFGTDGQTFNGWKPANNATRQMLRDGAWDEYSATSALPAITATGVLNRQYVGIVALASGFPAGAQFYYQNQSAGASSNFTFVDAPNEGIQVFGDTNNGNFDNRSFFKLFCREQAYTFDEAVLGDVGETNTGAFKVALPISVASDLKITANDAAMTGAPYNNVTITYFATNQNRSIGGTNYPFRRIVDGNGATLEQIYTKLQFLLRQNIDIDSGAGTVTGKTADALAAFEGDTLRTFQGVYIDNIQTADSNRIIFTDQNGVARTNPFEASGAISFNSFLVGAGSSYRMFFTAPTGAGNDYGEAGAITVNNAAGSPIAGTISAGSVPFTFDYDGNTQAGFVAGTDRPVTIVAIRPGAAKYVVATGTITRSKSLAFSLVAEQERGYV